MAIAHQVAPNPSAVPDLKKYEHALRMRSQRWCEMTGALAAEITARGLRFHYLLPLLRLSNAQLFFRVIGDLVIEEFANGFFNMTPP